MKAFQQNSKQNSTNLSMKSYTQFFLNCSNIRKKQNRRGTPPDSFYEVRIIIISKLGKDTATAKSSKATGQYL